MMKQALMSQISFLTILLELTHIEAGCGEGLGSMSFGAKEQKENRISDIWALNGSELLLWEPVAVLVQ